MTQQINLYHPIFRKERKRFSALAMLQAGAVMVTGILVMYGFSLWHVHKLRATLAEVTLQSAAAAKRFDEANARFSSGGINAQIGQLEREVAERQPIVRALQQGELGSRRGYSSYFVAFSRQHVAGLWLTGFSIGGADKLSLQGRTRNADLVPLYITRLGTEKSLSGLQLHAFLLKQPSTDGKTPPPHYLEFQISTDAAGGGR